jgi:hypothetical protein
VIIDLFGLRSFGWVVCCGLNGYGILKKFLFDFQLVGFLFFSCNSDWN